MSAFGKPLNGGFWHIYLATVKSMMDAEKGTGWLHCCVTPPAFSAQS
jgi:hypothetical protein